MAAIALVALTTTGCEYLGKKLIEVAERLVDKIPGKKEAETVAQDLFAAIASGDSQRASTYYAAEYFQKTSPEQFAQRMERVRERLGDLQTYQLRSLNVKSNERGTFVEMEYTVTFSKGPAEMTLVLYKPPAGGGMKIVDHRLRTDLLS